MVGGLIEHQTGEWPGLFPKRSVALSASFPEDRLQKEENKPDTW